MASLSEVYDRKQGIGHANPHRVVLGVSLFLAGVAMAVIGLVIASTDILAIFEINRFEARRFAGVLGGIGVPAVFVGILTVLPANSRVRAAAGMGAGVALVGVVLFWMVYPDQWLASAGNPDRHYTFETATIYFVGMLITFWSFFVAVVNFKTRNDPGGTVSLEVRKAGRTRIVEVDRSIRSGLGGIGLLGSAPNPSMAATRTVSDGGSASADLRSPLDDDDGDILRDDKPAPVDRYCGNCQYFEYVRGGSGMTPYCGFRREAMEDMEPCDEWAPN